MATVLFIGAALKPTDATEQAMSQFITATEQTKVRVAQDAIRSPLTDKKTKAGMQKVLESWAAKARAAGFETLRAWVEASQAAGIRPAAMLAPKWDVI